MQVYVIINGYTMLENLVPLTTSTIKCLEDQLQVHCQTDNEKKNPVINLTLTLDSGNMNDSYLGGHQF